MKLIWSLVILYVSYYTLMYARMIWEKRNNKLGAFFVAILAISIVAVPLWQMMK